MGTINVNGSRPIDINYGSQQVSEIYYGSELVWSLNPALPTLSDTYGDGVSMWVPEVNGFVYFIHCKQVGQYRLTGFISENGIDSWIRFTTLNTALPTYTVGGFYYWYDSLNTHPDTFRVAGSSSTYPYHDITYNSGLDYQPLDPSE